MSTRPPPNAAPALLLAMLGVALALLLGGLRLAKRAESVSIDGDRVSLGQFARAVQDLLEERQAIWRACLTEKAQEYRDD